MAVLSAETCHHAKNKVVLKTKIVVHWRKYLYMIEVILIWWSAKQTQICLSYQGSILLRLLGARQRGKFLRSRVDCSVDCTVVGYHVGWDQIWGSRILMWVSKPHSPSEITMPNNFYTFLCYNNFLFYHYYDNCK